MGKGRDNVFRRVAGPKLAHDEPDGDVRSLDHGCVAGRSLNAHDVGVVSFGLGGHMCLMRSVVDLRCHARRCPANVVTLRPLPTASMTDVTDSVGESGVGVRRGYGARYRMPLDVPREHAKEV